MDRVEWSDMRGRILEIAISEDRLAIRTDLGVWAWIPEGDCCAHAYLDVTDIVRDEIAAMVGQTIVRAELGAFSSVENRDAASLRRARVRPRDQNDTVDTQFYKIIGGSDDLTLTLYTEHNGYYGGTLVGSYFGTF